MIVLPSGVHVHIKGDAALREACSSGNRQFNQCHVHLEEHWSRSGGGGGSGGVRSAWRLLVLLTSSFSSHLCDIISIFCFKVRQRLFLLTTGVRDYFGRISGLIASFVRIWVVFFFKHEQNFVAKFCFVKNKSHDRRCTLAL